MSPLITEGKRRKRQLDKEFFGDEIANKLNGAMPSPSVVRVRALIERLKALSEKSAQLESFCLERKLMRSRRGGLVFDHSPFSDYELSDPEVSALAEEIESLANELSVLLRRYLWRPDVEVNSDGTIRQVTHWAQIDEELAWENATVHWLISELPTSPQDQGAFAYFTHCERCGDWFFSGREGAKFCRAACRVMSHAQTDKGRAEKASYMKKLRAQERERKRKKAQSSPKLPGPQSADASISNDSKQRKGRI
jgi:uncharacterized Zn finger protein (UPF0148 family)